MSGSGNDFVIIDNRERVIEETDLATFIEAVCRRKISVGADGFILIESDDEVDFRWHFFNSDGGRAEMCGNGARCAARFAFLNNITGPESVFRTDAGMVEARMIGEDVRIKMPDPFDFKADYTLELEKGPLSVSSVNTGVPHVVVPVEQIDGIDVVKLGREIRYHRSFGPAGTNANFISEMPDGTVEIRTYERGVEDETLACGTGSVAGALVMAVKFGRSSPVRMLTRSGFFLTIHFSGDNGQFTDVALEGDARVVYSGELWEDSWNYPGP
jgi:diaminopimelate epimerase